MDFLTARPIAHRGLHDRTDGILENSPSAFRAAVSHRYAIECDVQISADGEAMVFHDRTLNRMTGIDAAVNSLTARQLGEVLLDGSNDTIRTLAEHLKIIGGAVPLVVELKSLNDGDITLADAVAAALKGYDGDIAVMSFGAALCSRFRVVMPDIPRGLTAEGGDEAYATHMAAMENHDLQFISYSLTDLPCRFVAEQREAGVPVISWTVRSPKDAEKSVRYADQITFETYLP